jgi:DNA polymerase-3 subunit delta
MSNPPPTFYVFHGADDLSSSEALAELRQRLGTPETADLNTTVLDGTSVGMGELRHACDTVPFLADKRLVIVTGLLARLSRRGSEESLSGASDFLGELCEYLPQVPETTRLVFVESQALPARHAILKLAQKHERGYVRRFDPPEARQLGRWVEKRAARYGGGIEGRAAQHLAALVGSDLRVLDQEVDKLVTYAGGERKITVADIDAVVPYAQAALVFDLVDAMGGRDSRSAARVLHGLLDGGEHPLRILAMIVRQFRLLIQVKELKSGGAGPADVARELKLHPYPAGKLWTQANRFTTEHLDKALRQLLETDVRIKTGQIDAEVALDLLVEALPGL